MNTRHPETLPRLTITELRQLLTAAQSAKQDPAVLPDCFVCQATVTACTATLGTGSEDERVVTVQPCGHRMTYSLEVAEMLAARMKGQAATEATEPAGEDTELEALRREVAAARQFAAEMREFCSPHGVAPDYADRLLDAMDRAKEGR